jgi:DNA polymerase III epsilon subunit-like protein
MSFISVDVESDGRIQGINSIVCFGAVIIEPSLKNTFYGKIRPISDQWEPEALAISGFSREEHLTFEEPKKVMKEFEQWILNNSFGRHVLMSDNNGYDHSWISYYFNVFNDKNNPFGWTSRRIGDLYCGMEFDAYKQWKHLRDTKHTHDPLDDAMGNAEVVLKMQKMGLKIKLV